MNLVCSFNVSQLLLSLCESRPMIPVMHQQQHWLIQVAKFQVLAGFIVHVYFKLLDKQVDLLVCWLFYIKKNYKRIKTLTVYSKTHYNGVLEPHFLFKELLHLYTDEIKQFQDKTRYYQVSFVLAPKRYMLYKHMHIF